MSWVPPSGEVLAEEIHESLVEAGIPRDEQGEVVAVFVRAVGDELAEVSRMVAWFDVSGEMPS